MKLLFEEITKKIRRYSMENSSWFPHVSGDFSATASLNFSVSRRDSETVLLKGELEGQRVAACDRCGEQLQQDLQSQFVYLVTTREEPVSELSEVECTDEDATTLYVKEPEVEVDSILREQLYLALPLRNLCSNDCKGICAGCGVFLNNEACCCSLDQSNSAFAVLKKLTSS